MQPTWAVAPQCAGAVQQANPLPPGGAQELARQARVGQLQCIRMSFDHPRHALDARQAPPEVLTVLRALVLPDAPHAHVVFNVLLDHGHVEQLALVPVLASHHKQPRVGLV